MKKKIKYQDGQVFLVNQEKDKEKDMKSSVRINFHELEELINILDPNEEIFLQSKTFLKEIKKDDDSVARQKDGHILIR